MDVSKLVSYLRSPFRYRAKAIEPPLPDGLDQGDMDDMEEALLNDASEESQMKRKLSPMVGYMEISEDAGGFSCGNCKYATPSGVCINAQVRAPVSAEYGCCNLFRPAKASITFPPAEALPRDDEGNGPIGNY